MRRLYKFLTLSLIVLVGVFGAHAQDADNSEPLFATVTLEAGVQLDPFLISVTATGTVQASTISEDCVGYISEAPDIILDWSGDSDLLRIFFHSDGDATLTVITPDGSVYCNDDANGTLVDPLVDIDNPQAGEYAVHVGHFNPDISYPGFLVITSDETYNAANFSLDLLVSRDPVDEVVMTQLPVEILLVDNPPLNGNAFDLELGFGSETIEFEESGQIALFNVQTNNPYCTGFVQTFPTAVFEWSGEGEMVEVFVESTHDTTLMIHTPSGEYICNDDTEVGGANLNPSVVFNTPDVGRYAIYVGSFEPGAAVSGTITITEDADAAPSQLTYDDLDSAD